MENKALQLLLDNLGASLSKGFSPYGKWLDGTLEEAAEGKVRVDFIVREEFCNPLMMSHGGWIAGVMDEVMGIAVFSLGRTHFYTTINIHVDYFASSKKGDKVSAIAQVIKTGNTILNVTCELWDLSRHKLLAKGASNLIKIEQEFNF